MKYLHGVMALYPDEQGDDRWNEVLPKIKARLTEMGATEKEIAAGVTIDELLNDGSGNYARVIRVMANG